jgi:hypothetical protein
MILADDMSAKTFSTSTVPMRLSPRVIVNR